MSAPSRDALSQLDHEERLQLMRFVCSFAWADLEVQSEERALVARLIERLALDERERQLVRGWLEVPPPPEDIDPVAVPAAHRRLFRHAIREIVSADGTVTPKERVALELFDQLVPER